MPLLNHPHSGAETARGLFKGIRVPHGVNDRIQVRVVELARAAGHLGQAAKKARRVVAAGERSGRLDEARVLPCESCILVFDAGKRFMAQVARENLKACEALLVDQCSVPGAGSGRQRRQGRKPALSARAAWANFRTIGAEGSSGVDCVGGSTAATAVALVGALRSAGGLSWPGTGIGQRRISRRLYVEQQWVESGFCCVADLCTKPNVASRESGHSRLKPLLEKRLSSIRSTVPEHNCGS
jgi:hypothetical protein